MASQHLTGNQRTTSTHLDGHLMGIRDEFDRLNHELDETRKQRDEYISKYNCQVEELRELRQTISSRENNTGSQRSQEAHDDPPLISPISSSSAYAAFDQLPNQENREIVHLEGEGNQEANLGLGESDGSYQNELNVASSLSHAILSPATESGYSEWDIEPISNSTAALNMSLTHKLTLEGEKRAAFSMDGKYLATASSLGVVSIFDTRTGKRISVMKDLYHDEKKSLPGYTCLEFGPDSKHLATGGKDGNVRIWMISQRRVRNTFRHQNTVEALNFSPNGQCIVTCSIDETVMIWRLRDGFSRVLTDSNFHPHSVRLSLDGRYIASGCYYGKMMIWNVRTGNLVARWQGHNSLVASLAFTPDGKSLLSGSWSRQVVQWDVSFLGSLGMANPPNFSMMEISRFIGHSNYISSVSISPDGKWIASGSWDNTVEIWNGHDASLHCILHCPSGWVSSVNFSPVGNCLAIGGGFEDVTIWNYVDL